MGFSPPKSRALLEGLLVQGRPVYVVPRNDAGVGEGDGVEIKYWNLEERVRQKMKLVGLDFDGEQLRHRDRSEGLRQGVSVEERGTKEAGRVFFEGNEFLVPITALKEWVGMKFTGDDAGDDSRKRSARISDVVTRIGVFLDPNSAPRLQGTEGHVHSEESDLAILRKMENLQAVRIVLCDMGYAGLGWLDGLRRYLGTLIALNRARPDVAIEVWSRSVVHSRPFPLLGTRLPLENSGFESVSSLVGGYGGVGGGMNIGGGWNEREWRHLSNILVPLTQEEQDIVRESRAMGLGKSEITVTALVLKGWEVERARWVVGEGAEREVVTRWMREEEDVLRGEDVVMGGLEVD